MTLSTLRLAIVMVVLAAFAWGRLRREWPLVAQNWRYLAAMGALGYTGFSAFFYWSAHYTSAVNIGVIQGVTPVLVLVGGFLAYRARISPLQAAGAALTLAGVAIVASHGSWEVLRSFGFNIGDLGILASSALYAGYTVALRERPAMTPLALFAGMSGAALVAGIPLLAVEMARGQTHWPDARGFAILLFVGLVSSLACQLAYMRGVALIGPGRAGLFINLIPVIAAFLGVAVLGETFAPYHAVGLALVLGGIWLAERRRIDA